MKDKQFDPAGNNEKAPAEGMAATNTHNPGEEPIEKLSGEQKPGEKDRLVEEKESLKNSR